MLGWNTLSVVVVLTIGISAVIAQTSTVTPRPPPTMTTLKPSQGRGPEHCKKCGSITDDVSKKIGLVGASVSSCNLVNGISTQGINASLFECVCKPEFSGPKSDGISCFDVDECDLNTDWCDNHATCTNTVPGFMCTCDEGLFSNDGGKTCNDTLECASGHKCGYKDGYGDFGDCNEIFGSYACTCNSGFLNFNQTGEGDKGFCKNIDECTTGAHTCQGDNKNCRDTVGSYECYCDDGYFNDTSNSTEGTCENINECGVNGTNNCGAFTKCVDLVGGYECHCEGDGFRFVSNSNTTCEDYNECDGKNYTCKDLHKSQCINYDGGYSCGCDPGYLENNMTGICEDIDECDDDKLNECVKKHAACTNNNGSYSCACQVGFTGDGVKYCSDIDECQPGYNNICDDKAKCNNTIGNYTCQCISGYKGDGTNCTETITLEHLLAKHTERGRDRYRLLIQHEMSLNTQLLTEKMILQRRCDEITLKRSKRQVILPSRFLKSDGEEKLVLEQLKQKNSLLRLDNQGMMRDCNITADGTPYYWTGK